MLGLFMCTACLDSTPEDPRSVTEPMDSVVDAMVESDQSVAEICPSAPVSEAEDDERCIHTFVYRPRAGESVSGSITGDFLCPAWSDPIAMTGPTESGEWYLDLRIRPGQYTYKFVVDGAWIADPEGPNGSMTVSAARTLL